MLTVKNNLIALTAQNQLAINRRKNTKTMEKLSSGYRINRAADDAAGLTISENMRYQVRGLNRASHNVQEGISLIQTADGAMGEISDMLHRMKELSVQAANATNTPEDRANIQKEIDSLLLEVDHIQDKTLFNGIRVLDGGSRIAGGTGGPSGGHYGQGYGIQGGLPAWVTSSRGTTSMGYLSETVRISNWELICTSLKEGANPVTGIDVTNPADNYIYQTGLPVREPGFMGMQERVQGMNTLDIADGTSISGSFTAANGKTYTYTAEYSHTSKTYAAAYVDFSKANASNIQQLIGNGFFTTCTMCDEHYSVEFVDQGGNGDGWSPAGANDTRNHIYKIDINGITNGNDLIDKIVNVLGSVHNGTIHNKYNIDGQNQYITSAKPNDHYNDYAAELDQNGNKTGRLMIISIADERGSFINPPFFPDRGLFNSGVYTYGDNVWIPDPSASPSKIEGELHIQTGAKEGDAVLIGLPVINCDTLGLLGFSVLTEKDAGYGIETADSALDILNDERTSLGAWQNRLEHTYANVTQTSENTQAAESRLRDCDMSREIMSNSIQQILLQAGISVLAQANQQPQMILNMLA